MDLRKRTDQKCLGWHCLSSAEHFGIIFASIVVGLTAALIWMCWLGQMSVLRKQQILRKNKQREQQRQRQSRALQDRAWSFALQPVHFGALGQPSSGVFASQPVMYGTPIAPPYVIHQPSNQYQVFQQSQQPWFYQSMYPGYYPQAPQPAANAQQPPFVPPVDISQIQQRQPPEEPQADALPHRQHSWRQKLSRLIRLPVGRASTIASSEDPADETADSATIDERQLRASVDITECHVEGHASESAIDATVNAYFEHPQPLADSHDPGSSSASPVSDAATVRTNNCHLTVSSERPSRVLIPVEAATSSSQSSRSHPRLGA